MSFTGEGKLDSTPAATFLLHCTQIVAIVVQAAVYK
jgi:hypothetical protein